MIDFLIFSFLFIITFLLCGIVYVINHERKEQNYIRFRELLEKATPKKKKINYELGISRCPSCGKDTYNEWYKYCPNCGQRIEGEEEDVD